MLIKKNKEQKEYLLKLKKDITDYLFNFKKRYNLFPWNSINKLIKTNIKKDEILKVEGKEYTIDELVKTINDIKSQLIKKQKPSYYNIVLKTYIKDSMNKEGTSLKNSYSEYSIELKTIFKQMDLDLRFCLDALKEINKYVKSSSKEIKEAVYELMEENVIINKKDLYKNFDKFESGKSNVVLVTGFSGSGKSTLASQIASKYKAIHYELDCLGFYINNALTKEQMKGNEDGLLEYVNKHKEIKPGEIPSNKEENEIYKDYIPFLINWCKKHKDHKYVIEGLQIYEIFDCKNPQSFITSNPIIIKGTSGLVSAYRGTKRNCNDDKNKKFIKEFKSMMDWVMYDNPKIEDLTKSVKKDKVVTEGTHNTNIFRHLYHVSTENLDGKILHPRIPHNSLTEHDLEENKTARICFCPSIDNCLMALSDNLKNKEFYVHIPKDKTKYEDVYKNQVADAKVTKEKWVTCDVELICIGKIKVSDAKDKKYMYDFKDVNKEEVKRMEMNSKAYLYKWNWKWIEKYSKESEDVEMTTKDIILESMSDILKDNTTVTEGANLEIRDVFKTTKKKYKEYMSAAKKADKAGDYKKAYENIDNAIKVLKDSKKEINTIPSTGGSVIFGLFSSYLPILGEVLIVNMTANIVTKDAAVGGAIASIYHLVRECKATYDKVKDKKAEDIDIDDFNLYKNILLEKTDEVIKYIEKYKEMVKYREEKASKTEVKESVYDDDMKDFIIESYTAMFDDESDDVITEGANLEIRAIVKETKSEFKLKAKLIKGYIKKEEYAKARNAIGEMNNLLDKSIKQIKAIEPSNASIAFGIIANSLIVMMQTIGMAIITLGFGAVIPGIKDAIAQNSAVSKTMKDNKENYDASTLDTYRNRLIGMCEEMKRQLRLLSQELKKKEAKKAKAEKAIKESTEFATKRRAIYEACGKGEITIEEREELIKELRDNMFIEHSYSDADTSKAEKFESVKSALYKKCTEGTITVEQREDLIQKARDMIFTEAETTETTTSTSTSSSGGVDIDSKNLEDAQKTSAASDKEDFGKELVDASGKMADALKNVQIKTDYQS